MGEKPTAADEAKTNVQDFEKNAERAMGGTNTSESPVPGGMEGRQLQDSTHTPPETGPVRLDPTPAVTAGGGTDPTPAEATTVKGSKSNSSE